jgi:hypothetical protein
MAGAVVLVVNPGELLAQARDSTRVGELNSLSSAISLYSNSIVGGYKGEDNTVYISIPDTSSTCANLTDLPSLPAGWSYNCVTEENLQNPDGTGWLPINLNAMPGGSPFEQVPIDPKNEEALTTYYAYVYDSTTGNFALTALLESEKQGVEAYEDGGNDPSRFEIGKGLSVWSEATGVVGYWKLDEGEGTTTSDYSTYGNDGVINGAWAENGKINKALEFNGSSSNNITISNDTSLNFGSESFTVMGWGFYRDYTYPRSSFMFKKSIQCYATGVSNAGFDIGHGYKSTGADICIRDINNAYIRTTLNFNSGQRPPDLEDEWAHYAFVFNREESRVIAYINGVRQSDEVDISVLTGSINSSAGMTIGTMYGWQTDGFMDELQAYSRALTDSEIRAIYNATK